LVVFNEPAYAVNIAFPKTAARLQSYGIKPKLGYVIIALNVNVLRLISVTRVEEESIRSNSHYRRHASTVLPRHKNSPDFDSLPA